MSPPNQNRPPVGAGGAMGTEYLFYNQYTTRGKVAAIAEALQLKPCARGKWQGTCPACGYQAALSLADRYGQPLWHCHACGDSKAVQQCIFELGLWERSSSRVRRPVKVPNARLPEPELPPQPTEYLRKIWNSAQPIEGTLGATYLRKRTIAGLYPVSLRFKAACWHSPTALSHPAIVSAVVRWPSPEVIGIHRTYLAPDGTGKLSHEQSKMMLGHVRGGAVQLAAAGEALAITEGIETALSVQIATGLPTWACLSTGGMQSVALPDTVREVIICADHDPPGLKAARLAAERIAGAGKRVRIATPPQTGNDFNDLLKGTPYEQ